MKSRIHVLVAAASLVGLSSLLPAAEEKSASKTEEKSSSREEKKSMRVLTSPGRDGRVFPRDHERREKVEMETIAFLGVETAPVATTTSVQLGLAKGTGLVVQHVVAKSPADGVLQEHDILLKLDDQILIETRQLSVLIRTRKEGDEVVLTYLRSGQRATAKIKLGKTEAPKLSDVLERRMAPFAAVAGVPFEFAAEADGDGGRADVDRMLGMIKRAPNGEPVRIQMDAHRGPGFRAMALHTDNSSMVFSDDDGSLELKSRDGVKTLVAKDAKGGTLFSGPVNTPEERQAMPAEIRARLEKLEGMHDITFRTDGEFRGGQLRVMRPRGISFPAPERSPLRAPGVL